MLFDRTIFIGVDPTAGKKPFTYAAVDSEGSLVALGQGESIEALAFIGGQSNACVAVCAPSAPNIGLLEQEDVRQGLNPPPKPGRWLGYRLCEYQLRMLHIGVTPTPAEPTRCPTWVQRGFAFHHQLQAIGYRAYPADESPLQWLEVYPHACFVALLGQQPFPKHTLEGRLQRQLLLEEAGLKVPDAMRFFEEVTRHRLLKGILPDKDIYSAQELDALVAALTAFRAIKQPQEITLLGAPQEGQIALPVGKLKAKYS